MLGPITFLSFILLRYVEFLIGQDLFDFRLVNLRNLYLSG